MTNIKQKALELVNEVRAEGRLGYTTLYEQGNDYAFKALCRAIEQHEAFRQAVSDAVEEYFDCEQNGSRSMLEVAETRLQRFIIAKPDPLVEVLCDMGYSKNPEVANDFRSVLAKRGGRIVFDD